MSVHSFNGWGPIGPTSVGRVCSAAIRIASVRAICSICTECGVSIHNMTSAIQSSSRPRTHFYSVWVCGVLRVPMDGRWDQIHQEGENPKSEDKGDNPLQHRTHLSVMVKCTYGESDRKADWWRQKRLVETVNELNGEIYPLR